MKTDQDSQGELDARLLGILDDAMRVDGASKGKIRVFNEQTGRLEIRAQRGFSPGFLEKFGSIDAADPVASAVALRLKHRVTVTDVGRDPHCAAYWTAAPEEGFKSMQSTPLLASDGRVIGTLSTHFHGVHHPTRASSMVLDFCAHRAAALIEEAQQRSN